MPNLIRNLGLGFIWDDDELITKFLGMLMEKGKVINGYYGCPNIFTSIGNIDFFVKTKKNDKGNLEVAALDTHCCGLNVWKLRHVGIDLTPKDELPTSKVCMFKNYADGSGMVPIHIINADVLPSYLEDDVVELQMCAFPLDITYYADDEAYENDQPRTKTGKQWLLADGSLIATGFLNNHQVSKDKDEATADYSTDDHVLFKGTVKKIKPGIFTMGEENVQTYIRCVIDTPYGELELAHTVDQVDEKQRENIKEGSVVFGICILSGDASINEYDDGIIKDFNNNFDLLRQVIVKGQAERMHRVLCEDAVYVSDASNKSYNGIDEIVDRFNYVHKEREGKCFATPATITEVDDDSLEYPVGTRCILISYNTEEDYSAIAFLDVTEDGMIKRICVSTDERYHFKADEKVHYPSPLDNVKYPESVAEPIYMRADFHGMIDDELTLEELVQGITNSHTWERNVENMLEALKENPQPDVEVALENLFGYLFAKAIEMTVNENKTETFENTLIASYSPEDAFNGEIYSELDEADHEELVEAMELGKQFYKDFKNFTEREESDDKNFMENIMNALVLVQHIGTLYAERIFD